MTDKPVFGDAPTTSLVVPPLDIDLEDFTEAANTFHKWATEFRALIATPEVLEGAVRFAREIIEPSPQAEAALKELGIDPKGEEE